MAEIKFSQLTTAAQLTNDDIFALAQMQGGSLSSVKTSMIAVANFLNTQVQYTTAYNTQAKTTAGAINELKQLISLIPQFAIEVVEELPTEDISDTTIYLVPAEDPEVGNYYEEYIHVNDAWELVGTTAVDLSAYYTKLEVDAKFSALATVATSGSYNDLTNKPDLSALMDVNETTFTNPYTKKIVPSGQFTEKLKKLIGASVVWNQLVQNGNFADTSNWSAQRVTLSVSNNVGSVTLTDTNDPYIDQQFVSFANHKYLYCAEIKRANSNANARVIAYYNGTSNSKTYTTTTDNWEQVCLIVDNTTASNNRIRITEVGTKTVGDTFQVKNAMVFDLTAYFGNPTIADYVYSLESAQVGSGVAWLKSYGFFTEDYYAYSANTMQSVSVSAKKNVGKNLINAYGTDTNNGYVYGQFIVDNGGLSGANTFNGFVSEYCEIYSNTQCVMSGISGGSPAICFYDKNKTFISGIKYNSRANFTFTTPSNAVYFRASIANVVKDTSQLEVGSTATSYTPYIEPTTYPLDHTTLRGLFKLDANNNLYADGDIYPSSGNGSVKYALVNANDLEWVLGSSTYGRWDVNVSGIKQVTTGGATANILHATYETVSSNVYNNVANTMYLQPNTNKLSVCLRDSSNAPTGVFQIELATPTTATLTPYTSLQNIESGGTEEFIDYGVEQGTRDVAIPAGNETAYGDNELVGKVVNYIND